MGCYFPLAGVPFIWLGEGGWLKKTGLSLAYVVFLYGLVVVVVILFFLLSERISRCL
jgi:hypothetical protein